MVFFYLVLSVIWARGEPWEIRLCPLLSPKRLNSFFPCTYKLPQLQVLTPAEEEDHAECATGVKQGHRVHVFTKASFRQDHMCMDSQNRAYKIYEKHGPTFMQV